jgi:hypothetical protein
MPRPMPCAMGEPRKPDQRLHRQCHHHQGNTIIRGLGRCQPGPGYQLAVRPPGKWRITAEADGVDEYIEGEASASEYDAAVPTWSSSSGAPWSAASKGYAERPKLPVRSRVRQQHRCIHRAGAKTPALPIPVDASRHAVARHGACHNRPAPSGPAVYAQRQAAGTITTPAP